MKNERIVVYWIEDNPIFDNKNTINGVEYPRFSEEDNFIYYLFQHPMQVKEYLQMISNLNPVERTSFADKCQAALPDIVVFDYLIKEGLQSTNNNGLNYTNEFQLEFLRKKSVSHCICKAFKRDSSNLFLELPKVQTGRYTEDAFKKELNVENLDATNEFGLYCGLAIVREFKDYTTVGIPATLFHKDNTKKTQSSIFYEWLNSYDLKDAIDRPADDSAKSWKSILEFSAQILRTRIVAQIQTGKATPDYTQLCALAEGNIPDERIFSFKTIYGKRDLPLDGLFIDKSNEIEAKEKDDFIQFVDEKKKALGQLNSEKEKLEKKSDKSDKEKKKIAEIVSSINELSKRVETLESFNKNERNIEIWRFANTILSKLPISNAVIKKSNETAIALWNIYLKEFEDRIVLSDYSSRNGSLNATETAYLEELKTRLGVNSTTGLIGRECSIQTLLINKRTTNVNIIRLTALITLTKATIELEKQRVKSNFSEKYTSFTKYEYLDILYPKANFKEPLLLSLNVETDKDGFTEKARSWLSNNLTIDSQNEVKIGDIFKFENWILKGEKEILKSIFFNDNEYHPQWLK